jgi:hypothetical protein
MQRKHTKFELAAKNVYVEATKFFNNTKFPLTLSETQNLKAALFDLDKATGFQLSQGK